MIRHSATLCLCLSMLSPFAWADTSVDSALSGGSRGHEIPAAQKIDFELNRSSTLPPTPALPRDVVASDLKRHANQITKTREAERKRDYRRYIAGQLARCGRPYNPNSYIHIRQKGTVVTMKMEAYCEQLKKYTLSRLIILESQKKSPSPLESPALSSKEIPSPTPTSEGAGGSTQGSTAGAQ